MSLTAQIELAIRKAIAEKMANVTDAGDFLPSPIYFVDRADFFATVNPAINTQYLIETTPIAFCCLSLLKFEDSRAEGCADEPLVRFTYNFYFFREYSAKRVDESLTPDEFLKKNLKSYNAFIKTLLDARIEFLGLQNLVSMDFPENFDIKCGSLAQDEFLEELKPCRYIPKVKGHAGDLQGTVQVLINEAYA